MGANGLMWASGGQEARAGNIPRSSLRGLGEDWLSWLLGNYSKEEAKRLVGENLRGEISERSEEVCSIKK